MPELIKEQLLEKLKQPHMQKGHSRAGRRVHSKDYYKKKLEELTTE